MTLRRRTSFVGVIVAIAAAVGGSAAASTRPQHAVLPARLWVIAPGPDAARIFTARQAAALRESGINALVAERRRLTESQISRLRARSAVAHLLVFVAYPISKRPASCRRPKAPLCVVETTSAATAAKLAARSLLPVVLRLTRISQARKLAPVRKGRVIVLAPLVSATLDRASWNQAGTMARAGRIDLGAATAGRTAVTGDAAAAFEAVATGKPLAGLPPPSGPPAGPPGEVQNLRVAAVGVPTATVTWDAPSTGSPAVAYNVTVDGSPTASTAATTITLTLTQSCILGRPAAVAVTAVDALGETSLPVGLSVSPLCGGGGGGSTTAAPAATVPDAPTAFILSEPSSPSAAATALFSFGGSSGVTLQCSLDGAPYGLCTSPVTYVGLTDGPHTFAVQPISASGATGTAVTYSWTVDTVAPDTSITAQPTDPSNSSSPSFSFASADTGAGFRCSLDTGAFTACTSPTAYTALSDGTHTFRAEAVDLAGNVDPTPAAVTWTVSTGQPDTSITSQPALLSASGSASFSFASGVPGVTFQCSLDGSPFAACASPKTYAGLGDGSHTFRVEATDSVGNTDPTPATFAWTIDTVAPDTSITAQPANPARSGSAAFSFASSETGSSFECALDGAGFTACASPEGYSGLADGSHTFQVRARDGIGNADSTPASVTWTIDATAPGTTITGGQPTSPTTATSASLSFSSTETGSTFQCALDTGAFATCTSPKAYTSLTDGSHTFQVKATDTAGNTDATPASTTWTIDTTAPSTTITAQPADPANSSAATFSFSSTETGTTFQCALDTGAFATCTSPKAYTSLTDGSHTFQVKATDTAGNTDATPASTTWTIDTSGGGTSSSLGNLWIDGGTGSCTRSATPVAYSAAVACATPQSAQNAAQGGDTVMIKQGTYNATFSISSGGKSSAVTYVADGWTEPASVLDVLSDRPTVIYTGGISLTAVDHVHVRGVSAAQPNGAGSGTVNQNAGGIDICDTRSNCPAPQHTDIYIEGFHGKNLFANGSGITIDRSEFGGWDACVGVSAGNGGTEDAFRFWSGAPTTSDQMTNNTLESSVVHDLIMGTGDSQVSSVCGLGSSLGPHVDCMQNNGGNNIVVQNNIFYNCPSSDTQWDPFAGGTLGSELIQNNYFGPTACCNATVIGTQDTQSCSQVIIRNNIMAKSNNATSCPSGGPQIYGNIFIGSNNSCGASAQVYSYNVFTSDWTTTCGSHAARCDPVWTTPFSSSFSLSNAMPDPTLSPSDTCARGAGNPGAFPSTDFVGVARPAGPAVDAGPSEVP